MDIYICNYVKKMAIFFFHHSGLRVLLGHLQLWVLICKTLIRIPGFTGRRTHPGLQDGPLPVRRSSKCCHSSRSTGAVLLRLRAAS